MNTRNAGIVVVGSTMIDLIAYAARLPDDGETVVGERFQWGFGGKGANQAVMAARFGTPTALVNAVGDDDYGTSTIANLAAEGIATDHVIRVAGSSGVAPIWVDGSGANRIIVIPGANDHVTPALAVAAVRSRQPSVVVGQFEIPQATTAAAFGAARDLGATTVLNPAPAASIDRALLAVTDWLVPNETEFALIAGIALETAGARTPDEAVDEASEGSPIAAFSAWIGVAVAVTLGVRGVALVDLGGAGTVRRIAAPRVDAIDTTGAGDAFVGAFAAGLALGWSPDDAARLGCAAASDSVTRAGTQRSYPDRARAAELLAAVAVVAAVAAPPSASETLP